MQLAFAGTQGPRVLPGTYTARMTKGGEVYEQKFEVGLDRRAGLLERHFLARVAHEALAFGDGGGAGFLDAKPANYFHPLVGLKVFVMLEEMGNLLEGYFR